MLTLKKWKVRRSGPSMTLSGQSEAGAEVKITGISGVEWTPAGIVATGPNNAKFWLV